MKHRLAALALPLVTLVTAAAVFRGGWAVITVQDLPPALTAGGTTQLSFTVRQHAVSPTPGLKPEVVMWEGRDTLTFHAVPGDRKGVYTAALRTPRSGEWRIRINSNFYEASLDLMPISTSRRTVAVADHGRDVFVAKGCISCHQARGMRAPTIAMGAPDLTQPRYSSEYLRSYITDPSIRPPVNPNKRMPDLELKAAEINAIVAFLNAPAARTAAAGR